MPEAKNLVQLVVRSMDHHPENVRLRWRDGRTVRELDGASFLARAASAAFWLRDRGVGRGDRVGICSAPCAEWIVFDVATLSLGAVTVPYFANLSEEHLAWELRDSAPKVVLCGDREHAAAVQRSCAEGTVLVSVPGSDGPGTVPWESLEEAPADVDGFRQRAEGIKASDLATIIYTSGSTGRPKGVVLDHGAMTFQALAAKATFPSDPAVDSGLSCLPLAHVFERIVAYYHLASGHPLAIARDVQDVATDLALFRPSIFTVVPRLLEKMLAKMDARVARARGPASVLGRLALRESLRERHGLSPLLDPLADALVWKRLRDAMGGRIRLLVSGGAPLSSAVELRMRRMGVPVLEGYGLTEHGPVVAVNHPGATRPGTVGPLFPGVEMRLEPDSELLVRSPSVFRGYWNHPEEDRGVLEPDGWLRTGDLASCDPDGFLRLTGRKKDLCKTAGGKYVASTPIEDALARHPLVEYAVVSADGRKFVSAVLALDPVALDERARAEGVTESDIRSSPWLSSELEAHLARVNAGLDEWEKIRRWIVAPGAFTIESGEVTPTLKVRRSEVLRKFARELDGLYS